MRRRLPLFFVACAAALLVFLLFRPHRPVRPPSQAPRADPSNSFGQGPPPSRLPLRLPEIPEARLSHVSEAKARFEGRVVSAASGAGIPGAELTFSRGGAGDTVRTGPDGRFAFEPAARGRWLLAAATAPGYFPFAPEWGHSPVQLLAEPGRQVKGIEVHLTPALELLGRVVTARGDPAPDAEVRLFGALGEFALVRIPDRFVTDSRGAFRVAAPLGSVLEARLPGNAPGRAEVDELALANGKVKIALGPAEDRPPPPRAAILGRVTCLGEPVPGAIVTAIPARAFGLGAIPTAQAVTLFDGRFALADLLAGPYRLLARAEGREPGSARAVAGEEGEVEIELKEGGRLRGCVRDAGTGAPVAPFTVLVFARRNALWVEPERSLSVIDPGGCYALDDLRTGPAAVVVSAPGRAPSDELSVEIPVPPGEAVEDVLLSAGGTLTGVVRDDATGAPLSSAHLGVEGSLAAAASTFPVLSEATTGPDGAFAMDGLPRRFSIAAAAAGHHARVLGGLSVEPGGWAGPIEIRLRPLAPGEEPRTDLVGIGVAIAARDDGLVVTQVVPGGGAAEAGLAPGDVIVEVNGRPVAEIGFGGSVDTIRGPEGTTVLLEVRRGDATLEVEVPRRLVRG